MVNAFSFCLYGPEKPIYYDGLFENIDGIRSFFPDWVVYVWLGADVPEAIRTRLANYPSVRIRETHVLGAVNMIHRFYAIDDPDVDIMMVRDADSRIHWKDRWAIREFLRQPQFIAHTIRDHRDHTALIMGGLWGLRKSAGLNIHAEYASYQDDTARPNRLGHDQNFLGDVLYGKIVQGLLVHHSNNRNYPGELAVAFPFAWSSGIFCGQRVDPGYGEPARPLVSRILNLPEAVIRVRDAPAPPAAPAPTPALPHLRGPPPNLLTFLNRK